MMLHDHCDVFLFSHTEVLVLISKSTQCKCGEFPQKRDFSVKSKITNNKAAYNYIVNLACTNHFGIEIKCTSAVEGM